MERAPSNRLLNIALLLAIFAFGCRLISIASFPVQTAGMALVFASYVSAFILTLPWGFSWYAGYTAAAVASASVITPDLNGTLGTLVSLFLPSLTLFLLISRGTEPLNAITVTAIVSAAVLFPLYRVPMTEHVKRSLEESKGFRADLLKNMEKTNPAFKLPDPERDEEMLRQLSESTLALIPSILFVFYSMTIYLLYSLAALMGSKFKARIKPLKVFTKWEFDWNFVWLVIIGFVLFYLVAPSAPVGKEFLSLTGRNMLAIGVLIFSVAGFSIMLFGLSKFINRFFLRALIASLIILFIAPFLTILGMMDIWLEFRKPAPLPPQDPGEGGGDPGDYYY